MKKLLLTFALFGSIYALNAQNTWNGANASYGTVTRTGSVNVGNSLPTYSNYKFNINSGIYNITFDTNSMHFKGPDAVSYIGKSGSGSLNFTMGDNSILAMSLTKDGNVGIGLENPSEKLTVDGMVFCEEVKVVADVTADYVFQKYYTGASSLKADYTMPTLEEVEAYTKANHHLPEVPSAAQIKEEGMQLKKMTNLLLQKVEELTLYTIEQEKRIKVLEAKLNKAKL